MNTFTRKLSHTTNSLSLKHSMYFLNYKTYHAKPFWIQLFYILLLSTIGFLALKASKPRVMDNDLNNINVFFTSVSTVTLSSMSTINMEVFSNFQLIVMTILMLLGGEVFSSLLFLLFPQFEFYSNQNRKRNNNSNMLVISTLELSSLDLKPLDRPISTIESIVMDDQEDLKYNSIKTLGYVVLGYHVVVHAIGITLLIIYIALTPSANQILNNKGLPLEIFSIFTVVSTFSNCGFIPTNENMMVFRKNPGLLLILIPQIFLGNTLYSPCLRVVIWALKKFTQKKEYTYMLKSYKELGYDGLISTQKCWFITGTVLVFYLLQMVVFSAMDWSSGAMEGMTSYEKFVGSLFQTANTRHTGEAIVDFSMVSSAVLVLFIIMMYFPSCFTFLPIGCQQKEAEEDHNRTNTKQNNIILENMLFSQMSYLAIFVILICITERKTLKEDPLNFNVLSIVFEVISAYGNVGLSMGYSCARQLKVNNFCQDKMYSFSGRWSNAGKLVLIIVMFFGRLKKFNLHGGKAWKMQ